MALVAYGSGSDSDSNSENESETPTIRKTEQTSTATINNGRSVSNDSDSQSSTGIFNTLPQPKNVNANFEEDDEFLKKKEKPTEKPPPKPAERKPAQILLPSLASFEDDEESQPKFKKLVKGAGLLNMLPEPRSGEIIKKPSINFVPHILTRPPPPKVVKPVKPPPKKSILVDSYNSSDDSDLSGGETEVDFFSLNKNEVVEDLPVESNNTDLQDDESEFKKSEIKGYRAQIMSHQNIDFDPRAYEDPDDVEQEILPDPEDDTKPQPNMDDEAMRKLCSSRERRKGEAMQFIDIDQKAMLPDTKEWLTKAITQNTSRRVSSGKRRGDGPTNQQKRKHQITYLAHQAKANEQDLQNQWANNRMTKKQTQSKYGF
ncbi:uncharacterized protein LOC143915349 [Arctopsyche grandis]|uniref:uncharacterized protein LOC143915349 n=1 Tax=Arctopsyche grandis TaxID=121162 RepID=UPI00406D68C5